MCTTGVTIHTQEHVALRRWQPSNSHGCNLPLKGNREEGFSLFCGIRRPPDAQEVKLDPEG